MSTKWKFTIGLSTLYFFVHLLLSPHYGLSWDYHYHFYAGLYHLGLPVPSLEAKPPVPFSPPDPRLTTEDPFGPITQIMPSLSQVLLHDRLGILPFDTAYNLPAIIFGSMGVGLLFLFLYESIGLTNALFGSLFLALLPAHFGYLHTNMKDVPNAFFFTLAVYSFWKLSRIHSYKNLLFASIAFALAFNTKINSIFVPVICFAWFVITKLSDIKRALLSEKLFEFIAQNKIIFFYFFTAPVFALLFWIPFWRDPIGKLLELPLFYSSNTLNMPVLFDSTILRSGVNIPWYYPFVYILITTPIAILLLFVSGLAVSISKFFGKNTMYSLLLMWFSIPLIRYFVPHASAIDGVRHFMEVVYPLCAIAGIGAGTIIKNFRVSRIFKITAVGVVFLTLSINIIRLHPYETSFYNWFTGGVKGAWGKFDIDFWGTPQKEAILWINDHVPINAVVHIVMAQSSAAMYLRSDVRERANSKDVKMSDYVVLLNKESFFDIYNIRQYFDDASRDNQVVFTVSRDGVPLVWVIKN